jgi:hypothetical protein
MVMKIRCDVCDNVEATVFCCADEAALCDGCDHRVHHANKLASKHSRFSLVHPSFKESPLCDICQVLPARSFTCFSLTMIVEVIKYSLRGYFSSGEESPSVLSRG